jgi:hypothetical protein
VGLKSLKSLNLTNGYPNKKKNNNNNNNNKVKSKPLELFELAGKKSFQEDHISGTKLDALFVRKNVPFSVIDALAKSDIGKIILKVI